MPIRKCLIVSFILVSFYGICQNGPIDSLLSILKNISEDTNKVITLHHISREFANEGDYVKSKIYALRSIELAQQLSFKNGEAIGNKIIGNLYFDQGDYSKAIEFYFNALSIYEQVNHKTGIAFIYTNIGNAYSEQADNTKAVEYYNKAIDGLKNLKMQKSIQYFNALNGIGRAYENLLDYDRALSYYFNSQMIAEETGDLEGLGISFNNIGNVYKEKGKGKEYKEALEYFFKSLKIREETGDKYYIATTLNNIGSTYYILKQNKEALDYCSKSLSIAKEIEALDLVKDAEFYLSSIYEEIGNKAEAFVHYKEYVAARDSIFSVDKIKKLANIESKIREEKIEADFKEEQIKKEAELTKQKTIRYAFTTGFALVLILVFVVLRNLKQSREKNKIIESQKTDVEAKNHVIEEKQKEILDSITYAKRIQHALLASTFILNKNLPEYFLLFKPKDIVSGDFYWASLKQDRFYLAICDSTGHGVPGAFMSLLNISYLNEAVNEKQIKEPNLVLDHVRNGLINALRDDGSEDGGRDGMDCVLSSFDFSNNIMNYSAANNSFYLIRNNELLVMDADKMPVGKSPSDKKPFTLNTVQLQKDDVIYILTDGYPDQFGGPQGKKFKYRQLEETLLSISNKRMDSQKEILNKKFNEWKGSLDQVDDVLIIGMRV